MSLSSWAPSLHPTPGHVLCKPDSGACPAPPRGARGCEAWRPGAPAPPPRLTHEHYTPDAVFTGRPFQDLSWSWVPTQPGSTPTLSVCSGGSQSWCGCGNRRLPSPGGPLLRVLVDSRFDPSSPVQFLIFTIQTRTLSLRGGGCSPAVGTLLAPPCLWGSSLNYRPRAAPARSSPQLCSPTEQGGCPEG